MDVETIAILVVILTPVLVVVEGLLAILIWRATGHRAPRLLAGTGTVGSLDRPAIGVEQIAIWVGLSAVSMGVAFLMLFTAEYAILFTFGTVAASIGLVGSVAVLGSLPIVWALVILQRSSRR